MTSPEYNPQPGQYGDSGAYPPTGGQEPGGLFNADSHG